MFLTKDEINNLFKSKKSICTDPYQKIDKIVVEALDSFTWFNKKEFVDKYNFIQNEKIHEYNNQIDYAIEIYNLLIESQINVLNNDDLKEKIVKTSKYLFELHNLNNDDNPFLDISDDFDGGDISSDICGGSYDGTNGKMHYCDLEKNSRTCFKQVNLSDVFECACWSAKDTNNIRELIKIAQIFCNIGFAVYFVHISSWRKGFDFAVWKFSANEDLEEKIQNKSNFTLNEMEYFRIYIRKYA